MLIDLDHNPESTQYQTETRTSRIVVGLQLTIIFVVDESIDYFLNESISYFDLHHLFNTLRRTQTLWMVNAPPPIHSNQSHVSLLSRCFSVGTLRPSGTN